MPEQNTREFTNWFGDSKVCLRPGRPMRIFRGISAQKEERHGSSALGVFATADKSVARAYAGEGGKLMEVFMRIENPHFIPSDELQGYSHAESVALKESLIAAGHDGIFVRPIEGSGAHPGLVSEYIAFDEDQIHVVNDYPCRDINDDTSPSF